MIKYKNMSETAIIKSQKAFRVDTSVYKEDVFKKFVLFFSLPDPEKCQMFGVEKDPITGKVKVPTQQDFALKYGLAFETLSRWKNRKDFMDAVNMVRRQWGRERTSNVMASLYNRCLKYGMAYDIETYLAYFDNWSRTQVVKHVQEKFDVDDIRTIINSLPEGAQKDAYEKLGQVIAIAESVGENTKSERDATGESADN
jgi:hypothetical protein